MDSLVLLAAVWLQPLALIDFGRLEAIFTGFFQVAMIIGIVLFILGIFVMFFPGARKFLGGLLS